jgi:hypothetical protein
VQDSVRLLSKRIGRHAVAMIEMSRAMVLIAESDQESDLTQREFPSNQQPLRRLDAVLVR